MRLRRLIGWDLRFLAKYGFYLLYAALTVIYLLILFALPENWRQEAASVMIFSDPAAMGLFFMGAIVLLEKSQRVPCAMAVSPVKSVEYISSKVVALGIVSVTVATVLSLFAREETGAQKMNLAGVMIGTILAFVIFTLSGVLVASCITSLNQFILATVPVEIVGFVPAIVTLFWERAHEVLFWYPPVVCMDLIAGKTCSVIGLIVTIITIPVLLFAADRNVEKMWMRLGGVKL